MGAILDLRNFFPREPGDGYVAEPSVPAYRSEEPVDAPVDPSAPIETEACLQRAEGLKEGCARLLEAATAELPNGGPDNIDDLIEGLLPLERRTQRLFATVLRWAEDKGGDAEAISEPLIQALEALRDTRWRLMALRSEARRGEEAGPVFENAEELRRYVSALSAG
jgi:hypothetical protein